MCWSVEEPYILHVHTQIYPSLEYTYTYKSLEYVYMYTYKSLEYVYIYMSLENVYMYLYTYRLNLHIQTSKYHGEPYILVRLAMHVYKHSKRGEKYSTYTFYFFFPPSTLMSTNIHGEPYILIYVYTHSWRALHSPFPPIYAPIDIFRTCSTRANQ